ncbi:MAG: hypothetical protein ABWX63_08415 [Paeniglutamicibacter terrestris]|uniref:DUF4175 domain-containing protein n=1 Tax=Paeniglutamicibacter terrestris TaxID=2723403 RepID=A0ABX1G2G9_9MICC|nr:hypothetical protein [Paeniglutamicibacter terrestris]NKG20139.1 hypothetical protein [Paeniglutamicibacter terrestris]
MNFELLRSPWLLLAGVLLVAGAFLITNFALPILGWASIVAGAAALVVALLRTRT